MDLNMPRMGGLEAMRVLKCELPSALVVLVSTILEPATRKEPLASEAAACLQKGSELWGGLRIGEEGASRLI